MPALKKVSTLQLGGSTVEVWSDIRALQKQLKRFSREGVDRANMRALNRAATKTKTATGRLLSKAFNIKVGDLRPFLKVSPKASKTSTTVAIMGRSKMLSLHKFAKGKKKQGPLGVRFNSGGGSRVHPHTFIATMPSGHTGIFVRAFKKGRKRVAGVSPTTGEKYQAQLPIRELTYPSVAHMVTNVNRGQEVFELFLQDYPRQLFKQLDFEQKKSRGVG